MHWLSTQNRRQDSLTALTADASTRRYYRILEGPESYVVMLDPPNNSSMRRFVAINAKLRTAGINVPHILQHCETEGLLLMQDYGDTHYLRAIETSHRSHSQRMALYLAALQTLLKIQSSANPAGLPGYDEQLLKTELELFPQWYLERHLERQLNPAQQQVWQDIMTICIDNATQQPQTFVHRDYHSRNLMLTSSNTPGVLDYQDAVIGPITYDLVSLLRDCYIDWPEAFVEYHLEWHRRQLPDPVSADDYRRWFDITGLQRHLKVLGIFSRLKYRDGKNQYLNDIPTVLRHIHRVIPRYPELSGLGDLLNELHGSPS